MTDITAQYQSEPWVVICMSTVLPLTTKGLEIVASLPAGIVVDHGTGFWKKWISKILDTCLVTGSRLFTCSFLRQRLNGEAAAIYFQLKKPRASVERLVYLSWRLAEGWREINATGQATQSCDIIPTCILGHETGCAEACSPILDAIVVMHCSVKQRLVIILWQTPHRVICEAASSQAPWLGSSYRLSLLCFFSIGSA